MPERTGKRFSADSLTVEEIGALKEFERRNRDLGAAQYLRVLQAERGTFNLHAEARTLLHHIGLRPGDVVLDAGAGVGRLSLLVAPKVSRLVCADLSPAVLSELQSHAAERSIHNIETVPADLCNLPRSLGPFDRAYSVEVIQHIPSDRERRAALRRIFELLRPGGRCLVSVFCWNRRNQRSDAEKEGFWGADDRRLYGYLYSPRELASVMRDTGFRHVRLRGLMILPGRITRHLPVSLALLETWCSMIPALAGVGRYVMASGQK